MTLYRWSQTASADASADSTINWAEGQAPSSVNDSARAMMAATAKYRDDVAGAIVTTGTSTAYTVSSYQVFDTLAHLGGQMIAFTPHVTNGAGPVTLNVDSLGAKPLRTSPGVELLAGTIIQGTPYVAVYNNGDGAFYLQGFFGNPYNVPLAAGMDYWAATAPNSSFAFPIGQAISRTTYAALFGLIGTTYGPGDGSTTFNLPDKVGRVSAMLDGGSARISSTYFGGNPANLGASGGAESQALTLAQLPTGITSANAAQAISVASAGSNIVQTPNFIGSNAVNGSGLPSIANTGSTVGQITSSGNNNITVTSNNTSGNPHRTVQPTIVCNYILRII
jgi:microcystin-dependent protein